MRIVGLLKIAPTPRQKRRGMDIGTEKTIHGYPIISRNGLFVDWLSLLCDYEIRDVRQGLRPWLAARGIPCDSTAEYESAKALIKRIRGIICGMPPAELATHIPAKQEAIKVYRDLVIERASTNDNFKVAVAKIEQAEGRTIDVPDNRIPPSRVIVDVVPQVTCPVCDRPFSLNIITNDRGEKLLQCPRCQSRIHVRG